ncbi:MAG: diphosphomevalonate decarboxylase, partial [Bacteroidales bacterium]|nr:diphosphomevalonate decarboxylase [Bacteroidales bacterium]
MPWVSADSVPAGGLSTRWQSPSNIALVKYWGKYGHQLPSNASVSFTLSRSFTDTAMSIVPGEGRLRFTFEGKEAQGFQDRIQKTLNTWDSCFSFLKTCDITIESRNSFPHSAGIASSASAMSALAICLVDLEQRMGASRTEEEILRKASYLARLGSGSASRSVFPLAAVWGRVDGVEGSSPEVAVGIKDLHTVFIGMQDSILIVDPGTKSVSSSAGHGLMVDHPFAKQRFEQADRHAGEIIHALQQGDLEAFIRITEQEALTLHGLMMSSSPGYLLIRPGTLEIIRKVREFREQSGMPVCFTLDAGPNVHLLYPAAVAAQVLEWIKNDLLQYCHQGMLITDETGPGPLPIRHT